MRVMPGQGLYYREVDALLDEVFDDEYDEKHFTSIPSKAAWGVGNNNFEISGTSSR
jgi:hypothetical protein